MRRIYLIIIILVVLLVSVFVVYDNFIDRSDNNRVDIRGTVTNITMYDGDTASIMVEGSIQSDTYYDKASIKIDKKTLIKKSSYNTSGNLSDIKVGDKVEVTFTGPVSLSYPVQALAKLVNITK